MGSEMCIRDRPIGAWDVSNVTNMSGMFGTMSCYPPLESDFNQDISDWDVSNVLYMAYMFSGNAEFNQPIGDWDVSNVTDVTEMFFNALSFNQDLSSWDLNNVIDCLGFCIGVTNWTLPKPTFTTCSSGC